MYQIELSDDGGSSVKIPSALLRHFHCLEPSNTLDAISCHRYDFGDISAISYHFPLSALMSAYWALQIAARLSAHSFVIFVSKLIRRTSDLSIFTAIYSLSESRYPQPSTVSLNPDIHSQIANFAGADGIKQNRN